MLRATTASTFSTSNRHPIVKTWSEPQVFWHCLLRNVLRATTACTFSTSHLPKVARTCGNFSIFGQNVLRTTTTCTFSTSELPKVVRSPCVFTLFTSKCASRHNGVHFFGIWTSESRPNLTCFDTFYFQMRRHPPGVFSSINARPFVSTPNSKMSSLDKASDRREQPCMIHCLWLLLCEMWQWTS